MKKLTKRLSVVASLILLFPVSLVAGDLNFGTVTGKIESTRPGRKQENLIVHIKGVQGQFPPSQQAAVMDQKRKRFIPHLLPLQMGQKVIFGNSDPFSHNVHLYWGRRSMFNEVQGIGGASEWLPKRTGEYLILCNLHREMSAFVVLFDHPFFAIVDPQGEFKIESVPEGTYSLVVIRDVKGKLKNYEQEIVVKAGETSTLAIQW